MALALDAPLSTLKGVGPRRVAEFARVGVHCLEDLLTRFPLRYEDRSHLAPISAIRPGAPATVMGTIASCRLRLTRRRGFTIFEAVVRDEAGATLTAVWFNQRFLRDVFSRGQHVVLFGPARAGRSGGLELQNPQYELLGREGEDGDEPGPAEPGADTELLHTGRIVPIYERVGAVTPRVQRWLVREALAALPDPLDDPIPPGVLAQTGWPSRREALVAAHFPPPGADLDALNGFRSPAQQRLIFEEFYLFQLGVLLRRRAGAAERKPFSVTVTDTIRARARAVLPFTLTPGQRTALKEIVDDMVQSRPMHRLLQGDVGAGKTIVAVLAALVALENGLQVAFMAPTEILAEQHLASLARWLAPTRYVPALLTGRVPAARRRTIRADLANGRVRLVVGTHALVQEDVAFNRLGLAVIDEQHRFGVVQRAALSAKGLVPDVLVMTATPIPRTLALTAYGDLDVSVIRDRPPGRTPVRTLAKPESRRDEIYELLRAELRAGRQAYVVYPLIDESEKVDLRAATAMADHLAADVLPEWRVALLHGRLPSDAKARVMAAFQRGEVHVLVSTTVVEVGVDVPNATFMLVEHAERFGLAQLHQLRGRVGRGAGVSTCVLLHQSPLGEVARERLKVLTETTDGFVIAEKDLELRGPGDFFGTRQAGMPTLRMADLVRDQALLERARQAAEAWLTTPAGVSLDREAFEPAWVARFGLAGVG